MLRTALAGRPGLFVFLIGAAASLLLVAAARSGGTPGPCDAPRGAELAAMDMGTLATRGSATDFRIVAVLRDVSATVVVSCVNAPVRPALTLDAGGAILHPVGGSATFDERAAQVHTYFPPLATDEVTILLPSAVAGTALFDRPAPSSCSAEVTGAGRVLACGAFLALEVETGVAAPRGSEIFVDAAVHDGGDPSRPLGFYLWEADTSGGVLVVRFAVLPPQSTSMTITLNEVAVDGMPAPLPDPMSLELSMAP